MLVVGPIAGRETDLAQRIVEPVGLGNLGELAVVVDIPTCPLLNVGDHQAAGNIRDPVGEFDGVGMRTHVVVSPVDWLSRRGWRRQHLRDWS